MCLSLGDWQAIPSPYEKLGAASGLWSHQFSLCRVKGAELLSLDTHG